MTSPPAISISYTSCLVLDPLIVAYKLLFPIFRIPYPNAKEGTNLSTHYIANPTFLVEEISLSINTIRGPMLPNMKCKKNEAT